MKLIFQNQTYDIPSPAGSLFSVIGSVSGVQIHSPCGGHGTCKKCLAAVSGNLSNISDHARAALSDADAAEFTAKCSAPADAAIVYACLVPDCTGIDTVYLPAYEQLTGAGVSAAGAAASKDCITSAGDFSPVTRVKKITLTKPTIEIPTDTYSNLLAAVRDAFAGEFDGIIPGNVLPVTIPDDVLAAVSALIREDILELYAAVSVTYAPSGSTALTVVRAEQNAFTPLALACDIGTTTIAVSLWNAEKGVMLAEKVTENPQRKHGSDVISRMSFVTEHGTDTLFCEVLAAVRSSADSLLAKSGAGSAHDIVYVTVAGNSTMEHLFASIPTDSFSTVPFFLSTRFGCSIRAGELFAKSASSGSLFCHANAPVYLAPLSASYVGGDITFGLAYLLTTQAKLSSAASIFLDLGTNGEICCVNTKNPDAEKKFLFAATAAGPALEGAHIQMGMSAVEGAIYHVQADTEHGGFMLKTVQDAPAAGICGSGVIAAISAFLKTGLVTAFGRICDDGEPEDEAYEDIYPLFESALGEDDDGHATISLTDEVYITDGDIRQVQTAKAAISAGVSVLLAKAGVEQSSVDDLYIAGSFGGGIDVNAAAHIGLLPADAVRGDNIHAVGNTSAKGASMFLFSSAFRENLSDVMENSAYVELSSDPSFTEEYVNGMLFGDIE